MLSTPNPEIVMLAKENPALGEALERADMVLPDGAGIVKGAAILGRPMKEKVPGIDFACGVMARLAELGGSVYLFGAKPGVAEAAAKTLRTKFPGLVISGTSDGYFSDDGPIIEKIKRRCAGPAARLPRRAEAGAVDGEDVGETAQWASWWASAAAWTCSRAR